MTTTLQEPRAKSQVTNPWRVNERPAGDFAVQRLEARGSERYIRRWGLYPTRQLAQDVADSINRTAVAVKEAA